MQEYVLFDTNVIKYVEIHEKNSQFELRPKHACIILFLLVIARYYFVYFILIDNEICTINNINMNIFENKKNIRL